MSQARVVLVMFVAFWLLPAVVAFVLAVRAMLRPERESELERRLRVDREVARLDAIWYLPAYVKGTRA